MLFRDRAEDGISENSHTLAVLTGQGQFLFWEFSTLYPQLGILGNQMLAEVGYCLKRFGFLCIVYPKEVVIWILLFWHGTSTTEEAEAVMSLGRRFLLRLWNLGLIFQAIKGSNSNESEVL